MPTKLTTAAAGTQPRRSRVNVNRVAAIAIAADGDCFCLPHSIVTVARPNEGVRNLMQDRVANRRFVGDLHDLLTQADCLSTVLAQSESNGGLTIEPEQPVTEAVFVHEASSHLARSGGFHTSYLR